MEPIVVSIPHNGTRFVKHRLNITEHRHVGPDWFGLSESIRDRKIITPLRNPSDVWRSWCRRRRHIGLNGWIGQFFCLYGVMHALDQIYQIEYICVDKQEDPRITNWSPIGNNDGSREGWKLHDVELGQLYRFPFIQRHYTP